MQSKLASVISFARYSALRIKRIFFCTKLENETVAGLWISADQWSCAVGEPCKTLKHLLEEAEISSFAILVQIPFTLENERCFTHPSIKLCLRHPQV